MLQLWLICCDAAIITTVVRLSLPLGASVLWRHAQGHATFPLADRTFIGSAFTPTKPGAQGSRCALGPSFRTGVKSNTPL